MLHSFISSIGLHWINILPRFSFWSALLFIKKFVNRPDAFWCVSLLTRLFLLLPSVFNSHWHPNSCSGITMAHVSWPQPTAWRPPLYSLLIITGRNQTLGKALTYFTQLNIDLYSVLVRPGFDPKTLVSSLDIRSLFKHYNHGARHT